MAIFCTIGFLASVGLLRALWRRYFAEVSVGVVTACALALGLATGVPVLLSQADVYQVPICCGYMLTMVALAATWRALHETEPRKRSGWLAAASVAYGLAVGARPSLLCGAAILLVPVVQAWRERRRIWILLLAAMGPILLIGLGLMLYNVRRFGSPFEFGVRYQMTGDSHPASVQNFSVRYLGFNLRLYFVKSVGWGSHFPFVHKMAVPPLPPGHGNVESPFGVLANIPLVWFALAMPPAWWSRSVEAGSKLRWFVTTVALLFGISSLTLGLFYYTSVRYEVEFLPALLLLAVVGILGLERTLADRPSRRRAMRWVWSLLLGFSVVFNLLASVEYHAEAHHILGVKLCEEGRVSEAIKQYEQALRLYPDYAKAHLNLGIALERTGRIQEAIEQYEQTLRLSLDDAEMPNNLGTILAQAGRAQEATGHFEEAVRIRPDYAEPHYNLTVALEHAGRVPDAIQHYEQALQIKADLTEARNALARLRVNE